MKISSLVLWVQDATLSAKFYRKLGFDVTEVNDRNATAKAGSFEIMLVTMRDEEEFNQDSLASNRGLGMYVYVNVEDVDQKYQELKKLGLQTSSQPRDWEWGNREFVIKDPDGYKLCFFTSSKN